MTLFVLLRPPSSPSALSVECAWRDDTDMCVVPPSAVRMLMVEVRSGSHMVGLASADLNQHLHGLARGALLPIDLPVKSPFGKSGTATITLQLRLLS
jgi:hypothetical protein